MTTLRDDLSDVNPFLARVQIVVALALTVPEFGVRLTHRCGSGSTWPDGDSQLPDIQQ